MPSLVFDDPIQQAAHASWSAGFVFADLTQDPKDPGQISVWHPWTRERGKAFDQKLSALGAKLGRRKNDEWRLPASTTNLRALEHLAGDLFDPTERLEDWFFAEVERLNSLDNLASSSSDAVLSAHTVEEAPKIARMAHAYQRAGIVFGATTRRFGLFDQPGLGKTLQCFGAVVEAGITGDILVLAPTAAVAITWPDELAMWLPEDDFVVVNGDGKRRKQLLHAALDVEPTAKRRWFIVNLEMARTEWVKPSTEVRYPKTGPNKRNGTDPRKREFPVPGWWDYKYPELFGSFTIEEEYEEEVAIDKRVTVDENTGEYEVSGDTEGMAPKTVKKTREVIVEYDAWATIVVDESHRGLITKTSIPQDQTLIRAGMGMLPLEEGGLKIAMSGTPMRGKVENLWGTLNWLYPELYSSYWDWVERWFTFVELDDGKSVIDTLDENKSGEFYRDIQPYILRRTKKEVRAELPDKLYAGTPLPDEFGRVDETSPVGHWLEMHPKQAKAYAEIVAEAETRLESGILAANGRLAELVRMKQFASSYGDIETYLDSEGDEAVRFKPLLPSNKFDWIVEFLESLGITKNPTVEYDEDGNPEYRKVVIASQFTSLIDLYDRELTKKGIKCLKITGKVNTKTRVESAKTWQNGEDGPRVFLLNTMAGGVALTLDSADDLILVDETFIPDEQEQVEDRIHRVSRMHQVTIHYLRSLGTVEETIAMTTSIREKMTKLLLDGERGVKFFKKLVTPIKRS